MLLNLNPHKLIPNVSLFLQTVKAHEKKLQEQKQKQEKLITQLRKQLEEMEATVVKVNV